MITAIMMSSTMIKTIHSQVSDTCERVGEVKDVIKSSIKIISGIASSTKQQTITKPGSKKRHKPESRKFSVFAVP